VENLSNFDLGPLTWVKVEIDNALDAGAAALEAWNGQDTVPLREAATYLHQVSGALQIVDLQGVFQVNNAIEGLLADMQSKEELRDHESQQIVLRAIKSLRAYLDGLMAGGPNNELLLTPAYAEVQSRRGGEEPSPSDLFWPDLGARQKRPNPELPMDDQSLTRAIRPVRMRFQKGLLHYLQNKDSASGLQLMAQSIREMEQLAPGSAQYTFWWAAGAVMDAILAGHLPPDVWLKRMLGRLDLQMRRLTEGSRQLADRLFRDLLYFLSQDGADSGRTAEARELFELDRYLVGKSLTMDEQEIEALRPQIAAWREAIKVAKEQWMRLCAGRQESLEPFKAAVKQAVDAISLLPDGQLASLVGTVRDAAGATVSSAETAQNEALQLEMATALLLLQHAAENYFNLGRDFPDLAEIQARRLQAAVSGEGVLSAEPGVQLLDEIARQAQEKLLLAQVTREILSNLHQVEEVLDKFFRNQKERTQLPLVPGLLKQVQGAFNMLQLDVAAELVLVSLEHVSRLVESEQEAGLDELNWVAEAISTLGLYVEALRNGRDDPAGLRDLLSPPEQTGPAEISVEKDLEESAARLRQTSSQLAEGSEQSEIRDEIKRELSRIAQDADLVGDNSLRGQAGEAIRLLDEGASTEAIQAAVQTLSSGPVPPPAQAAPVPVAVGNEQEIDAELLQIYIEEAKEVLASISEHLAKLHGSALEHDAFVDIRRGFHTLKGSGRMVGLTDPAEVAWEVEQTLNLWLREERAVTKPVLDFIDLATTAFGGWVAELEANGTVSVQADALVSTARHLRGEAEPLPAVVPAATETIPVPPEVEPESAVEVETAAIEISEPEVTAPELPAPEPDAVQVGQHVVPAALFAIFSEESAHRLDDLRAQLADMADPAGDQAWEGFARSAHTLAGIARTTGLAPLAEAAHAVENWVTAWPTAARPLSAALSVSVSSILDELAGQLQQISDYRWPDSLPDLTDRLAALLPEPVAVAEEDSEAVSETETGIGLEAISAPELVVEPEPAVMPEEAMLSTERSSTPEPVAEVPDLTEPVEPMPEPVVAEPATPSPRDECDPQLLPIFLAEADELLPRLGESLRQWRTRPDDREVCQALQRTLHTLKGSARMAGAMTLGDNTHAMEARIVDWGEAAPSPAFLDQLEHEYDSLAEQVDQLRPGTAPAAAPQVIRAVATTSPTAAQQAEEDAGIRQAFRAKANILDNLINEAGEVSIARSRIEAALNNYRQTAQELTANVERLRSQLRELEIQAETQVGARLSMMDESHFDPLEFDRYTRLQELTRLMAESVNDVSTAQDNLLAGLSDAEYALLQQSRTTRNLQQELMHIRMVRLNSQSERLHRIVRQAAKELHRSARLHIEGGDIELDRTVLDKAMAPFEHLLRNAVAHGIEAPEVRQADGKPEYGDVRLEARQEGTEVVLTLSDDGGGIRLDKVRARAEALGWVKPGEDVERERLESFLFMPGFSTVESVTQVAGRGVGLDVVRSEIASVGGRVRVESEPGRGTRFTIRLPATLALSQVVLASAGDQVYAIPAGMVVLVKEMQDTDWHAAVTVGKMELDGQAYPLRSLAELTGQQPNPVEGRYRTVLLLRSGDERVALRVDKLESSAEVVVKAIGPQLSRVPGVAGATVLADGRVSLILNPFALVEQAPAIAMQVTQEAMAEERAPLVLVVDDSLTVRKITSRLLQREGYRMTTAKDGVEALEALQDELPAVMLLDIEMPRMDGFEVARHVRADRRTHGLPIIMITSRTADKHREHALELGVNDYMGKPYQEEELLAAIAKYVALSRLTS
jgi:chemosensory pili system protein ChpA (sensor histidine kinase/response regulator)